MLSHEKMEHYSIFRTFRIEVSPTQDANNDREIVLFESVRKYIRHSK